MTQLCGIQEKGEWRDTESEVSIDLCGGKTPESGTFLGYGA